MTVSSAVLPRTVRTNMDFKFKLVNQKVIRYHVGRLGLLEIDKYQNHTYKGGIGEPDAGIPGVQVRQPRSPE
jgi:hypothetical protein